MFGGLCHSPDIFRNYLEIKKKKYYKYYAQKDTRNLYLISFYHH